MKEVTTPHTGLLRLGLAVDQSTVFWLKADPKTPLKELKERAREEAWFQGVSDTRSDYLVGQLNKRFPVEIRPLLDDDPQERLICHWHLQLTDPIYRSYTSEHLPHCWADVDTSVTLEGTRKWVESLTHTNGWKEVTTKRLASALLSAVTDAGLCQGSGRERPLKVPLVDKTTRAHLKKLLELAEVRETSPYKLSVGLSEESK